ncbi:MAG: tetratricopeptide repeat protein [Promethearchaeota archaeon]
MYHIPTPEARSCFEKAKDFSKIKQFDEALYFLDEALKIYPTYINVWNHKGIVLCKILCKDIDVMLNMSDILCEMGKTEESIEFVNIALKLNPKDIKVLNKKEEILDKLGKTNILTL